MNSKKTLLILYLLVSLNLSCEKSIEIECISNELSSSLLAFYSFNEGEFNDNSGNELDLVSIGSPKSVADRFGNQLCAIEFDNQNSNQSYFKTIESNQLIGLNEFSISVWYNAVDTIRNPSDFEILIQKGEEIECQGGIGEWSLSLFDCRQILFNGTNNFVWSGENLIQFGGCQGIINHLSNRWIHIVATKSFDEYNIYFNGELKEESSGQIICQNIDPNLFGELIIGKNFNGLIDDIMIFDKELNIGEIQELHNSEGCCK